MGEIYDFDKCLAYTRGARQATDIATIMGMLPGCVEVVKTDIADDRNGVDYIVTLRRGAHVLIDGKTRTPGCSRWWKNGEPEVALEKWSVMPGGQYNIPSERAKTGWTLSERSEVGLILYTWPLDDSNMAYLLSYQILRVAFVRNIALWMGADGYKVDVQDNGTWESQAVFVPVSVVLQAMTEASCGVALRVPEATP